MSDGEAERTRYGIASRRSRTSVQIDSEGAVVGYGGFVNLVARLGTDEPGYPNGTEVKAGIVACP